MAQLVKHPTLGFRSGHYLIVGKMEPRVQLCADSAESAWDFLSSFLSVTSALTLPFPLSLKINKQTLKKKPLIKKKE